MAQKINEEVKLLTSIGEIMREPVVDYPTFLWSDYPTDYPISDTPPPVVLSVG